MIPEYGKIYFIEYAVDKVEDVDTSYVGWARCTGDADVKDSDGKKLYLFDLLDSNYVSEWVMFSEKDVRDVWICPTRLSQIIGRGRK